MTKAIESYIEASGNIPEKKLLMGEFDSLVSQLPSPNGDSNIEYLHKIKKILENNGIIYNHKAFTSLDLLKHKKGNCLGIPLLIGALAKERIESLEFRVLVSPQDYTFQEEQEELDQIRLEIRYDSPIFATKDEESSYFRFHPLEHLAIEMGNGRLLETTLGIDEDPPKFESSRHLSFNEALSFVYKDRAENEIEINNHSKAKTLLEKSVELYSKNRESWNSLIGVYQHNLDEVNFKKAKQKYFKLRQDDSLYHFNLYLLNKNNLSLNKSLKKYPAFAHANASNAMNLSRTNQIESKFQFAVTSQLFAKSGILNLPDFYIEYHQPLSKLFGNERITNLLESFEDERWGDFNYHHAMFNLTREREHLSEAREQAVTPLQKKLI